MLLLYIFVLTPSPNVSFPSLHLTTEVNNDMLPVMFLEHPLSKCNKSGLLKLKAYMTTLHLSQNSSILLFY